jgi:Mn-dependent DtxR family transcriptional regulator
MPEGMNELKMRIIVCLLSMEDHSSSVTHLAKIFNVSKSTISRACDKIREKGMVERASDNGRPIKLTAYGINAARDYERRWNISSVFLRAQGISKNIAEQDAALLALWLSEPTAKAFEHRIKQMRLKESLGEMRDVRGEQLCTMLGDGSYPFSYVFHRCNAYRAASSILSMANDGFESEGRLIVEKGSGIIELTAKKIEHISFLGSLVVSGSLKSLQYYHGEKLRAARKEGSHFFFPVEAVEFLNVDGIQYLQGSAILRMSCSVGDKHMPDSDAIFTMFI